MAIRLFNVFQHDIVRDQLVANTVLVVLATTMLMSRGGFERVGFGGMMGVVCCLWYVPCSG